MKTNALRVSAVFAAFALSLTACAADETTSFPEATESQPEPSVEVADPAVSIEIEPDPISGHNLFMSLANFRVAPEQASTEAVEGEGHMHLYIDGERVLRFYNEALHLADLAEGEHTVMVELSNNDHSAYEVDGQPVRVSETFQVEPSDHVHADHEVVDVDASQAPSISLEIVEDPKSGWNLAATVDNFTFAPRAASTEAVNGEGHMHLYVDGTKMGRLYGPNWHIAELTEGEHEIVVEMSNNDHSPYSVAGVVITASATVVVSAEQAMEATEGHDHDMDDDEHSDHDMDDDEHSDHDMDHDADLVIEGSVSADGVSMNQDRFEAALGSSVSIIVTTESVSDEVHLHGYDLRAVLEPGTPAQIDFIADVPGLFEAELEGSGTFLFEVQVQ